MNDLVEMVRNTAVPRGRDRFACSLGLWVFLQDLGQAFGWRPSGTTYIAPVDHKATVTARHNYHPGGEMDFKRIDPEDAVAWARALETARQSPLLDSMIAARWATPDSRTGPQPSAISSLIFEFMEYAYGGEFSFARAAVTRSQEQDLSQPAH